MEKEWRVVAIHIEPDLFPEGECKEVPQEDSNSIQSRPVGLLYKTPGDREGGSEIDGHIYQNAESFCFPGSKVFSCKNDHGLVEHFHIVEASLFGAFPFIMDDGGAGEVIVIVPGFGNPVGKIDVLPIHKKGLIQQSGLIQSLFAHKHKCTSQHIHHMGLLPVQVTQVVLSKAFRFWEERRETKHFIKGDHWGR